MFTSILKEACVGGYAQALKATLKGANRLEVCSDLANGGTTPPFGVVKVIKKNLQVPVFCIIRPRPGNFVFTSEEVDAMIFDIEALINYINIDGIVVGMLTTNGDIDLNALKRVISKAKELKEEIQITFHMAFDFIKDIENRYQQIIDTLADLGVNRILTRGGTQGSASEHIETLKKYISYSGKKIIIVPGGGITLDNMAQMIQETGASELHGTKIVGELL